MHRFLSRSILASAICLCSCNQHPVKDYVPSTIVEFQTETPIEPSQKIDILWVIDNSGSMCQEQAVLRENFDRFVDELADATLDFQIAVTTTQMDDSVLEPVARPGYLQSTPQPLPGFDRSCWTAVDANAQPIAGDYTPIRQLIAAAVSCMADPDPGYSNVSDADIACALETCPEGCPAGTCNGVQLFPDPSTYRTIPKVLSSEQFRDDDGTLRIDELKAEFACMSLVGMRGYGIEKGLGAVVEALSPELTGGTLESPMDATAPNHGFIRDDARFAAIFVTDENDCTHDGSLSEVARVCGPDLCEYWNHPSVEDDTPLVSPNVLHEAMMANLRATKGVDRLAEGDVLVASIHGRSVRYAGEIVLTPDCRTDGPQAQPDCRALDFCGDQANYEELGPTCSSRLGTAYSGDRYERFLRAFGEGNYFPAANPTDEEQALTGWMCTGDFRPALSAIGEFIQRAPQGCITREIQSCDPGAPACPDHATGESGACVPRPNSDDRFFCDSYVQLRVSATAEQRPRLEESGFCSAVADDGNCIVGQEVYSLGPCSGAVSGVSIEWVDATAARQALAGTELELRWISTTSE